MKNFNKKHTIFFCLFIIAMTNIIFLNDLDAYDYWWHVKAGEYIVNNKTIPFTDVFSWIGIQENMHWYSHEWLTEVVLYLHNVLFGKYGGYIFSIVCLDILVVLLFVMNKRQYFKNFKVAIVWVIFGTIIVSPFVTARPHMISFILLAITMYLLNGYRKDESTKKIWLIPLISLLWANFHGGSSNMPYVLCFMYIITGLFDFKFGRIEGIKLSLKQIKTYLSVAVLSIGAIAINPHGIDMIKYPYVNMNNSYMLSIISEWRCPDLKTFSDMPIFILIFALIFIAFILNEKAVDFTDLGLVGAFMFLTLKSIRFSILLYIVASFVMFKYINECKDKDFIKQLTIPLGLIGIVLIIFSTVIFGEKSEFMKKPVSDEIISVLKAENPQSLYNEYDIGGYLIYNDIKVFVDGRADLYTDGGTLKDAIDLANMLKNPEDIIDKYNFDYFVIYKGYPIDYYLESNDEEYSKIADDGDFVIYKRN